MAARRERGLFDPDAAPGESPFDHHIYVIASDGDIEEGVTSEASSLAGHQQLGNLVVIYDDNHISIEDDTDDRAAARTPRSATRPTAGTSRSSRAARTSPASSRRWRTRRAETDRPSFIALRTIIGCPAPKAMNTGKAHGSALGDDEVARHQGDPRLRPGARPSRSTTRCSPTPAGRRPRAEGARGVDRAVRRVGRAANPSARSCSTGCSAATCPSGWEKALPSWEPDKKGVATRKASGEVLKALGRRAARAVGRLGRPRREQQHHDGGRELVRPDVDRHEDVGRASPTAARCTSASASTPWARSSTASRCTAPPAPTAAPSSCSPTTCAAPSGSPR